MKRITCIITAFFTFILISINSLSVYASDIEYLQFCSYSYSITGYEEYVPFSYVYLYRASTNEYRIYHILTPYEYRNYDYLELTYIEELNSYILGSQSHLSSDTRIIRSNAGTCSVHSVKNCHRLITTNDNISYNYSNSNINSLSSKIAFTIKTPDNQTGLWDIVASTCNIKVGNDIIFQGSQSHFYSYVLSDSPTTFPYPAQDTPVEPPTEAPTIGEGGDSGDDVETSKNILENVKSILTSIANLPKNIANAIYNFFSDLLSGILTGLDNLKNGIIQGLKDLFIPSDNAFTDIVDMVKTKFSFAYEFVDIAKTILVFSFDDDVEPPNFEMEDKSGKWFNTPLSIIDWTIYEPYRPYVHALILAICWYQFIERTIKRLPSIIGGI